MQKPKSDLNTVIIVGLGNPGTRYEETRHNAGFWVLDALAALLEVRLRKPVCRQLDLAVLPRGEVGPYRVVLVKPLTYMNRSGQVLPALVSDPATTELILVTDNMDLQPGATRLKSKIGSGGGHNGLKSVLDHLGSWPRVLYVGIGRPEDPSGVLDHVLGQPRSAEFESLRAATRIAADGLLQILQGQWQAGVDAINSRRRNK